MTAHFPSIVSSVWICCYIFSSNVWYRKNVSKVTGRYEFPFPYKKFAGGLVFRWMHQEVRKWLCYQLTCTKVPSSTSIDLFVANKIPLFCQRVKEPPRPWGQDTNSQHMSAFSYCTISWENLSTTNIWTICNLCQSSASLTILVPLWFVIITSLFFYLSKLLFFGFLPSLKVIL